ncbi:RDD family protein [Neobacillus terrae]|uniref:RDD family protein n=1 Tax=Neobacillus terrae TaxID=3034837 RepID=UPI001FB15B14|nr:RDD family protein [Neobacillus terrae]
MQGFPHFIQNQQSGGAVGAAFGLLAILYLIYIAANLFYYAGMQATLGKQIVGVKVTEMNGNRISFGRALGRYFENRLYNRWLYGEKAGFA